MRSRTMGQASEPHNDPPVDGAEQRAARRYALLLRAGKLICDGQEFLCILRDASATGFKARLFHPLPQGGRYELELGNGTRYAVEPVWARDGHAGFRFCGGKVDVHGLLEETSQYPRRQIRLKLELPVMVEAHGIARAAVLRDLSQQGALIESDFVLALRQPLLIEAHGLPPLAGRVRWRRGTAHGVVFHTGFRLDELATLAARLHSEGLAMFPAIPAALALG
ncbi:MAG: PilZ domain-containing protein [Novosphingobium sp.]|jgi:hypothetical protein|nr:PilZ domain-containing protein [Novosphingobium sp.]